jgi:hypothetical protein
LRKENEEIIQLFKFFLGELKFFLIKAKFILIEATFSFIVKFFIQPNNDGYFAALTETN